MTYDEIQAYVDREISHLWEKHTLERLALQELMSTRAEGMERRLDILNNLREAVTTDRAQFVTRVAFEDVWRRLELTVSREYYDQQHQNLHDKIDLNTASLAAVAKEASNIRSRNGAYAAALGSAISILTIVMLLVQFGKL